MNKKLEKAIKRLEANGYTVTQPEPSVNMSTINVGDYYYEVAPVDYVGAIWGEDQASYSRNETQNCFRNHKDVRTLVLVSDLATRLTAISCELQPEELSKDEEHCALWATDEGNWLVDYYDAQCSTINHIVPRRLSAETVQTIIALIHGADERIPEVLSILDQLKELNK